MHGQAVPRQLPSPQHKVPAGWLRDVTLMLNQSWGKHALIQCTAPQKIPAVGCPGASNPGSGPGGVQVPVQAASVRMGG